MNVIPSTSGFQTSQGIGASLAGVPRRPLLIIVHQERSNPGQVGQWFRDRGFPLDIRRPRFGDPLPDSMAGHCAAVVFGGPMSANDSDDYVRREIDWLSVPLRENSALLGICLGGQMLSMHLGGSVDTHAEDFWEVGYHPVVAEDAASPWPGHFYQWHGEGFTIPESATRVATGAVFENQAFTYGDAAMGIQFHPEMTFQMVNRWTNKNPARLTQKGAKPREDHLRDHLIYAPRVRAWLDATLSTLVCRAHAVTPLS